MFKVLVAAVLVVTGSLAFADGVKKKAPPSEAVLQPPSQPTGTAVQTNNPPTPDDVDNVITNANLRAKSGSKSKWSLSNLITYDGGTVSAPFAQSRPNIAAASGVSPQTDINDQLNVKYTINPLNSLMLGFGVRKMAPFTGNGPSAAFYARGGKDVDFFDPAITYQAVYKFYGIQAVTQVIGTQYTRNDIHSSSGDNLDKNISFNQDNIYEIGALSVGGAIGFGASLPTDSGVDYSKYQWWFSPYVEYRLSPMFNLRTVANSWSYESYPIAGVVHDTYTQSVGLGCSVTRDIFLYPNVQFTPGDFTADITNVGLTATINLF